MEGGRRQGRPEEELFFGQPSKSNSDPQSTVAPLRIQKREGTSPTGSASGSNIPNYPRPQTASPPPASGPLPYPASDGPPQSSSPHPPYPTDTPERQNSPADQGRKTSASGRPIFSANDPRRPSVSGYAQPASMSYGTTAASGSRLAERRGTAPKPLPDSPGPETPDKEGMYPRQGGADGRKPSVAEGSSNPYPDYHQQYWPPPNNNQSHPQAEQAELNIPNPAGVNRLASTASVATTRAQRGSPPPPETPIVGPPAGAAGGIEARYAAATAAQQRQNQYGSPPPNQYGSPPRNTTSPQQQSQQPPRRPWTPTEQPGTQPHGPPTVYQGANPVQSQSPPRPQQAQPMQPNQQASGNPLENDFQRMSVGDEPPPAYSSVAPAGTGQSGYPNEKGRPAATGATAGGVASPAPSQPTQTGETNMQGHPAFANDPRQQAGSSQAGPSVSPPPSQQLNASPAQNQPPASPPPLPEGWIAHLDSNSGQYYYIHLPTQSTQWEFPKGPTPLNLNEPMSPVGSAHPLTSPAFGSFSGKPGLTSPGFPPQTPGFPDVTSPTASGFTGPPPQAGVDMYKVQPTNGVYFGPYLRYTNMDIERGIWLGSILLVTDNPQPPTIHIHQSVDLSPNPRQLKGNHIHTHQRWSFYRYDIDLPMEEDHSAKWTYAITSHLGCTRYEFLVAGRHETSWRFIAHSGNDFAINVNANERSKLGGVGFMWKDILQKHIECGGFHAQLGLGDQIYADRLWKEIPSLRQWTAMSGKDNRKNAPWTAKHEEDVSHAYFHYYTSHFDQPHLREAFAQIPHVLTLDDHDIFDGFGSYPEYMQFSNMFKNIGRIGIEMYLLFQHHTTLEILRNVRDDMDLFSITGTGWHFIKYLGPAVVVVGPDCRSERNPHQIMAGPTYQGLFPKVAVLPPCVQHCIWMIPVPIIYPRLESMEHIMNTMATGKKAVTGTFNMLGKVTSSVAGVVGAKSAVNDGFSHVKKAVGKSGLMSNILSPFGEIDVMDELRDQWTHESKDLERTYLIRTLQGIAHNKSLRMTFFSGDVSCCGAGLVHDPAKPSDHKTMYQVISSSVVNTPPSSYVLRMLHNNRQLFVPANGQRSTHQPSDTKEDMMEIFTQDVNGSPRELKKLMGRRNYVACVAYDPELVNGTFGQAVPGRGGGKLSLAVDFMVQNEGVFGAPMKYGPVIIPSLDYGR